MISYTPRNQVTGGVTFGMLFRLGVKEDPSEFYNYEEELEAFRRGVLDSVTRMIVVKGVRRIGKSSLIRVGLRLAGVSLYALFDARAVAMLTVDTVYDVISSGITGLLERAGGFRSRILSFLERVEGVSVSGFSVRFREKRPSIIAEALEALNRFAEDEGETIVLVFDEAQEFRSLRGFDSLLAHVYDYHGGLKLVLAGSQVGLLDRLLGRRNPSSPLYGRPALEIQLRRLDRSRAIEFLEKGFSELGLDWPRASIEEAVNVLDGIPGWLTFYGYTAYTTHSHSEALQKAVEEGSALIRSELESFLALRQQARTRYLELLRCLSLHPMSWSELKRCLETSVGRRFNNAQFTRYVRELIDYGFVVKENGVYRLADPLIAYAVKQLR